MWKHNYAEFGIQEFHWKQFNSGGIRKNPMFQTGSSEICLIPSYCSPVEALIAFNMFQKLLESDVMCIGTGKPICTRGNSTSKFDSYMAKNSYLRNLLTKVAYQTWKAD